MWSTRWYRFGISFWEPHGVTVSIAHSVIVFLTPFAWFRLVLVRTGQGFIYLRYSFTHALALQTFTFDIRLPVFLYFYVLCFMFYVLFLFFSFLSHLTYVNLTLEVSSYEACARICEGGAGAREDSCD